MKYNLNQQVRILWTRREERATFVGARKRRHCWSAQQHQRAVHTVPTSYNTVARTLAVPVATMLILICNHQMAPPLVYKVIS